MKEVAMQKFTYEVISLSAMREPQLPLIFHCDTIKANRISELSNWHEEVEILTVLSGEGTLHCDNEDNVMAEGDIMVISSNMLHSISSTSSVNYHCMILDSDFCREAGVDTSKLRFTLRINDSELREQLISAAELIRRYRDQKHTPLLSRIRARLLDALSILAERHSQPQALAQTAANAGDARIKRAIEYINDRATEPLILEQVADAVGVSKYHLAREFKRLTGLTVFEFVIMLRLKMAKRLLREGYSVSESAYASGFDNLSYFSRKFRKAQGVLPSAYAKAQREKRQSK